MLTAETVEASELDLIELPDDVGRELDGLLPPCWSRGNPIDLAGSETRDTIPNVMEVLARHPGVDALVYLGIGIQSNQAALTRRGRYFPDHGVDRITEFHERQDARYARAAADLSNRHGKPILTATELGIADPENAGPNAVRATGRLCYEAGPIAAAALEPLWRYACRLRTRQLAKSGQVGKTYREKGAVASPGADA